MLRSIYFSHKEEANKIRNKFKSVDPICQENIQSETKLRKQQPSTIEYFKNTSEKDERLHRKHIAPGSTVFQKDNNKSQDEIDIIGHRRKPLEKVYINKNKKEEQPRCKRNFPQYHKPQNFLFHNYQSGYSALHKPFMKTHVTNYVLIYIYTYIAKQIQSSFK